MKYTKTAIAVAVAGGFAVAPMMAAAETTLSGLVQVKLQGTDQDDDTTTGDTDESKPDIAAGDVRVAIATEHELNSGLIGYGNLQLNLDDLTGEGGLAASTFEPDADGSLTDADVTELTSAATVASDNIYVGVKGDFGDVRFGEIPLGVEYGQLANDIHDVGNTVVDGMSYTGSFGIFGVGLNYSPSEDSDMFGAGVKFNFAGATIGLGIEDRDETARYAIGASYGIAGFSIAVHYWAAENDFDPNIAINTDDGDDDDVQATGFSIDDTTNFAVQVGYGIAGVSLGLTYSVLEAEEQDVQNVISNDESIIRLDAGYDLGGGMDVSTRIQNTMDDTDGSDADDLLEYRVMLTKTF